MYILERICCHSSAKTKKFVSTDDPENDEGVGLSIHACACHKDQSSISSNQFDSLFSHFQMMIDDNNNFQYCFVVVVFLSKINEAQHERTEREMPLHAYPLLRTSFGIFC